MTIIVFLVDTSASMQQKAFVSGRSTLLDVAKGAVEFFVKMRQKSPEARGDRYMLLTFEEFPRNIKAGWKENLQTFLTELKNLEAQGMTTMGSALKQVFDTLNINRMQTGIDMYGQGRYPFYLEPAVTIVISDGGKLTTQGSVQAELNLPMHSSVPGSELTREPFRWDQRLYALVLRMAGTPPTAQETQGHVASDHSPIDAMCEVTGGRSYAVTSNRVLHQCIDSLVQKLQSGVVIHFDKIGADPPPLAAEGKGSDEDSEVRQLARADTAPLDDLEAMNAKGLTFNKEDAGSRPHTPNPILAPSNVAWHSCRRLIYVPRSAQKGFAVGFWPLPEAFWPDVNSPSLPQRSAHPKVNFTCTNQEPLMIESLPFDKYELEPSPLTLYILARKQPKVCWLVYIQGSTKSPDSPGQPFGYLKASTNLHSVNLFVLPYNFPVLLPLLDELFKVHRLKPSNDWRSQFHMYLRTMPAYYAGPLRRALTRMGAGNLAPGLIPETMDSCLSYTVMNYLKRLKNQAKIEYDKTLNSTPVGRGRAGPEAMKVVARSALRRELLANHVLKDKFQQLRDQITDYPGFTLGIKDPGGPGVPKVHADRLRNPFDIPRRVLLDQLVRMRANYLQPSHVHSRLVEEDTAHSLPIGQMGNYQDYLKKMPVPLREIESTPVRQHMFGNPFKINKNMILDEVMDEMPGIGVPVPAPVQQQGKGHKRQNSASSDGPQGPGPKRARKGPLPKDFVYRSTPPGTPRQSPTREETLPATVAPLLTPPVSPASPVSMSAEVKSAAATTTTTASPSNNGSSPTEADTDSDDSGGENERNDSSDDAPPLTVDESPPSYPEPPPAPSEPPPPPAALARQDSFRLSETQDALMSQEIAGMIGSAARVMPTYSTSSSSSGLGPRAALQPMPQRLNGSNGKAASAATNSLSGLVNGILNGRSERRKGGSADSSRDTSPVGRGGSNGSGTPFSNNTFGLSREELRRVQTLNQNMRQMIYKEVKRPGRDHESLFNMLKKDLHGPRALRRLYLEEVISEARRFKRITLADALAQKAEELTAVNNGHVTR